jgi:predicted nucleic acid-binding protein
MPTGADAQVRKLAGPRTLRPDLLLDTSAAVPLLVADHEAHGAVMEATRRLRLGLAGHAWFETYSVLTRLPPGIRRSPADVRALLTHDFPGSWSLDATATESLMEELAMRGIAGGAVYDALVGAAARHHDVPLLTADRRAIRTYDALGVRIRLLA